MGRRSRLRSARGAAATADRARGETRHLRHYADGRETPLETHMRLTVARTCDGCGQAPGATLVLVYVLVADLGLEQREAIWRLHLGRPPVVDLRAGPAVLTVKQAACSACRPALLRAVARGPSYAFVDIVDPPSDVLLNRRTVAVP